VEKTLVVENLGGGNYWWIKPWWLKTLVEKTIGGENYLVGFL
jgi:hypothetical protein